MRDIQALPLRTGPVVLLMHAVGSAWILPILQIPLKEHALEVIPTPDLTAQTLQTAREKAAGRPVYVLLLNSKLDPALAKDLFFVRQYAERDCSLLSLQKPPAP